MPATRPTDQPARIVEGAEVDESAQLGAGTTVWQLAHIREHAVLGHGCVIGRGVYVGPGVRVGNNVKVQNYALVYEPAVLEDGVFVGPAVVLTNDPNPRAVRPDGELKTNADWQPVGVVLREGAAIGARAVCVAPVTVGRWALVAAGATVVRDVPDFALVAGVPARQIGWVGRAGVRLVKADADAAAGAQAAGDGAGVVLVCPQTGARYRELDGCLTEVDG